MQLAAGIILAMRVSVVLIMSFVVGKGSYTPITKLWCEGNTCIGSAV